MSEGMTFRQLYDAVNERVPKGSSFCITVELWTHRHTDDTETIAPEWSIYVADAERACTGYFHGKTPEAALSSMVDERADPHAPLEATAAALSEALPGA